MTGIDTHSLRAPYRYLPGKPSRAVAHGKPAERDRCQVHQADSRGKFLGLHILRRKDLLWQAILRIAFANGRSRPAEAR